MKIIVWNLHKCKGRKFDQKSDVMSKSWHEGQWICAVTGDHIVGYGFSAL